MIIKYIKLPKYFKFTAITLFPFIFIGREYKGYFNKNPDEYKTLIRHEGIHYKQALELLIIPFYLWYLIEWAIRLVQYRNARTIYGKKDWKAAYRNISFEREAYCNDTKPAYLKTRKRFASFKYLNKTI